ncbi:MAG: ABC transporter substrate-binding protein [Thermomicrobiales bacterium]
MDTDATNLELPAPILNRRRFLTAVGLGGIATGLLAACGDTQTPTNTPASAVSTTATTAQTTNPSAATSATTTSGTAASAAQLTPVKGGKIIMAISADPDTLDPNVTPFAQVVVQNLYDTLIVRDRDFSFKSGLATSWTASADGLSYTFKLRQGINFHDGTPFDASAAKFTFDHIVDPQTKSKLAIDMLGPYAGSEVIDPTTVKVNFKEPYGPFLDAVSQFFLAMVSPAAVQKYGADFGRNPVGTGPWKFKEWVTKDHITFVPNEGYNWPPATALHMGRVFPDELTFRIVPDEAARSATLETNESNFWVGARQEYARLRGLNKFQMLTQARPGEPVVFLMNTTHPILKDVAIRDAISYAIDKEALIKAPVYSGVGEQAYGPISAVTFGFSDDVKTLVRPFDLAKAKQTLDGAGWKAGSDGVRTKGGTQLKFPFVSSAYAAAFGQVIQGQLRDLGIVMDMQQLDSAGWVATMSKGDFGATGTSFTYGDPDVLRLLWSTPTIGANNWTRVSDPDLDALLIKGRATTVDAQRLDIYKQAQSRIMQTRALVPLANEAVFYALDKSMKGLAVDPRAYPLLYDMYVQK